MSKYEKFSREDLIALVGKQDSELASKKYGLVWDAEREPEQVVLDCENNLPVLKRVKGKEIRTNGEEDNILIEGDNYHALTVLNYTHQEKIDVIYIDPPYNRGNNDFKYNDKFVEKEDGFRHSKWLNFMEKRLNLAKALLKETGVIFISIDENEFAQLKILCDEVFGEDNFLGNLIWKRRGGIGSFAEKNLTHNHEYIFAYKNVAGFLLKNIIGSKRKSEFKNSDERGLFRWIGLVGPSQQTKLRRPNLNYGVLYDSKDDKIIGFVDKNKKRDYFDNKYSNKIIEIWLNGEATWLIGKDGIEKFYKRGIIKVFKKKDNYSLQIKNYFYDHDGQINGTLLKSILSDNDVNIGMNSEGTSQIKEILFPQDFSDMKPKPLSLIKFLLDRRSDKDSIILDFFAGTGTTGQAVLELNKEDKGNRKFILCTNNENKICEEVTYPRLEKVIKGYKKNGDGEKVEGLGGNLQYFRTDLVRNAQNKAQVRISLTGKCTEMLCVKENIFNVEIENENYKIFSSNDKKKFLCVYYNFAEDGLGEFIGKIKKLKGQKIIYMFSVDNEIDKSIFSGVDDFTVEAIPEGILKEYEKLNKMNIPVNKDLIYFDFNKAKKVIFEENGKDDGAMLLRIVLEKTIQKIAQKSGVGILKSDGKGEKISLLNDKLKSDGVFSKVEWEENKTYLAIGNHAAHGEYGEYDIEQVKSFHRHIQSLLNKFGI